MAIRESANLEAKYIHDTAISISGTVELIASLAEDGACSSSLAEEAVEILKSATQAASEAISATKSSDVETIMPTIETSKAKVEELQKRSLELMSKSI